MKVALLLSGFGVCLGLTACAVQRSPEANAPAPSAVTAPAEERPATLETPAPAPPAHDALQAPKSKAEQEEREFANLESAERALNQAKADLDRLALAEPSPVVGESANTDRAVEKKASKPAARAPSAAGAPAPAPARSSNVCEDTCRAFSSLSRAASAVCRLDGNNGTHCSHAKHVLADAQQRVASCSCPATSE